MRIAVSGVAERDLPDYRAAADGAEIVRAADRAEADALAAEVDAVVGGVSSAAIVASATVRWVHSPAAGVDGLLTPGLVQKGIDVTSATGNGGIPLAEQALMLMLMLDRDAPRWLRAQQRGEWDRFEHGELYGTTVGLIGLGTAGAHLARLLTAAGVHVRGLRRRPGLPVDGVESVVGQDRLHEFLADCDWVVVTAPSTPETAGMLDAAALAAMKRGARLVCVSRGGIVDDEALLSALDSGHLGGAGLDAHGVEPLPSESRFWSHPAVIATPHNGATTAATAARGCAIALDNVRRFVSGEPLRNLVDLRAGY